VAGVELRAPEGKVYEVEACSFSAAGHVSVPMTGLHALNVVVAANHGRRPGTDGLVADRDAKSTIVLPIQDSPDEGVERRR
jgi:hypothetical protein